MKARLTRRALRHLREIHAYISQDSPTAASTQLDRIWSSIELLETFPSLGRTGRTPGVRELVVPRTPYIVVFRVVRDVVEVHGVYHGRRTKRG